VSIGHPKFDHHREPLGIQEPSPRISWRFESAGAPAVNWEQSSYDIEIIRDGQSVPEIFAANSSQSVLVAWPSEPLASGEAAQVRVRAHGAIAQSSSAWSDYAHVETGLLSPEDWHGAVPIAADLDFDPSQPKRPVYLRKDFEAPLNVARARLYITAFGVYEAQINGMRVGDHVLAPGWQSYKFRHVYNTYDVTELVQAGGGNTLGIIVGEGWYAGRIGFDADSRNLYGDTIAALALLVLTDDNGSITYCNTDSSWKSHTGPILLSEIYDGEKYDARVGIGAWSSPGYNADGWSAVTQLSFPDAQLVAPDGPPIRALEELAPHQLLLSDSGKQIVDFGQNLVGWLRLTVDGPAGTNITMVHAEVMENGEVSTRPLRSAKATDVLTLSGEGTIVWEPRFTYHGFRYVQIEGWPAGVPMDSSSIKAVVVHSDLERTGYFECSHPLLTRFEENVLWSMKGNFMSVPTDCPQRDERLGWTGDIHAFGPTANFLYDTSGLLRSWHRDLWADQQVGDTMIVPFVVPWVPAIGPPQASAVWGDVAVGGPWNLYRFFGDDEMLSEQYESAQAWVARGIPRSQPGGLWDRSSFQFGDWLDPEAPPDDAAAATTAKHLVADAYLVRMTEYVANMSDYLDRPQAAADYRDQHSHLLSLFQAAWLSSDGLPVNVTQTALTLALEFGLLPQNGSQHELARTTLRNLIAENDYHVGTGFAGTQHLGSALSGINATEDMYKMLLQTTVPSWLYQVVMGGTTTWERWDSLLPDGSVNPGSMTSFNHYAFGAVADWVHATIGGISPAAPGWKVANVAPVPGGGITSAEARFLSAYGEVICKWWVEGALVQEDGQEVIIQPQRLPGLYMQVTVPLNTRALVTVPGSGAPVEVGSGYYEYFVENFQVPA
jgi:alpha-L-rhamnosidase